MKSARSSSVARMQKARDAAALVAYSPDYVSRLAREEKIVAVQRGRDWYVDVDSLKLFALEVQAEQRARHQALRESRLAELATSAKRSLDTAQEQPSRQLSLVAAGMTVVACLLLLLGGVVGKVAVDESLQSAQLLAGAESVLSKSSEVLPWLARLFAPAEVVPTTVAAVFQEPVVRVTATGIEAVAGTDVAALFSDSVLLTAASGTAITITPVFTRDTAAARDAYTLQIVPVGTAVITKNPL